MSHEMDRREPGVKQNTVCSLITGVHSPPQTFQPRSSHSEDSCDDVSLRQQKYKSKVPTMLLAYSQHPFMDLSLPVPLLWKPSPDELFLPITLKPAPSVTQFSGWDITLCWPFYMLFGFFWTRLPQLLTSYPRKHPVGTYQTFPHFLFNASPGLACWSLLGSKLCPQTLVQFSTYSSLLTYMPHSKHSQSYQPVSYHCFRPQCF